jgi:hypothetical protein
MPRLYRHSSDITHVISVDWRAMDRDWLSMIPPDRTMLCSINQGGDPGPNYIGPGQVAMGAAVILVNAFLSLWLKLDMHWQLAIGTLR